MLMQPLRLRVLAFVAGVAFLAFSGLASADPPSRVARLGYMTGAVSFSPAGESDWVQASINRPLTTGDRLWSDAGARAEIQVGGALIRMSAGTAVSVLNLDDRIAQLQLTQGVMNVRVRRLEPNQVFEVDTPNLAFTLRRPGEYRIEVDPDRDATTIIVRNGQGEVYGEDASYVIDSRQPYRFMGTGLREYEYVEAPRLDEFDRWSNDRDRRYDTSISARYVSPDVVGYQDLDANGTWRVDASYGNVWVPNRVAAGWAPYRDGHWAWVDPWGWTWVDDAPWGFAVSHYGRWANLSGTWGWVPGPVRTRAYYAPALVVFVGGANFQISISSGNVGGIAWFPLGPREVYQPSYPVSRGYYENINRSNTVINNTVINNTYNNINVTNIVYANRQVPGAVVAVPTTAFVQSQPVSRAAVNVSQQVIVSAPVAVIAPVAPTERSVRGAAAQRDTPPARVFERAVVARTAPPAAHVGFAAQQQQLTAKPGIPLDETARKELKPAATVPAPVVRVVAPAQTAQPTAPPPPVAPAVRAGDRPGRSDERKAATRAPDSPPQVAAPSQAAPPTSAAQPQDQRGKAEQRGRGDQREQPVAAPPPPQRAAQPRAAPPPQVAPPEAAAPPQDQRGKAEQRGRGDQREQPVAAPPPPQRAAQPRAAPPPQVAPPEAAAPPQDQRGKAEQRGRGEQPVAAPPPPPRAAQPKVAPPPQVAPPEAAAPPQDQRGKAEQRGRGDQREQPVAAPPPPQRAAQPRAAPPPQVAPPEAAAPPKVAAPAAPTGQEPPQRVKREPAPAAKQAEPAAPVAAPRPPSARPQPAPKAEPPAQEPTPAEGKPNDKKKSREELKREEEERKQKG